MRAVAVVAAAVGAAAARDADLVKALPGFGQFPFSVYSGMLKVANVGGYDYANMHYQFHTSQNNPKTDPLVTWQQGGPGSSSVSIGLYTEMGYFRVAQGANGTEYKTNPYSWNRQANMLYFEHPAGVGFSNCVKGGVDVDCQWNDTTQAAAYYQTLLAWYDAFPEYKSHDLYITGESYAGQYVPNIAYYIMNNDNGTVPLKGIAVGNGCWGGDAHTVNCNGPNSARNDVDLFYGKGLVAKKLRDAIYKSCGYNGGAEQPDCGSLQDQMHSEVGPHNIYFIYDNCPQGFFDQARASGMGSRQLLNAIRDAMPNSLEEVGDVAKLGGGYDWDCTGGATGAAAYVNRDDVRAALHLPQRGLSRFRYTTSGPASVTLYPELVKKFRVLIYNGDADACVPYNGNEEWTTGLAAKGAVTENKAWHPWFMESAQIPTGYATTYTVPGSSMDFSFVTIRLAGHMVPTFQPAAAYSMFSRFLSGKAF